MQLLRAFVHHLNLPTGERVRYLRLAYRAGRTTIGRSVLVRHFPSEFMARVEASGATKGLVVGLLGNCANVQ